MKIIISPETELIMDPLTSVISKEKSKEHYHVLISQLTEAERQIDGLIESLSSKKPVLNTWKGRESVFETAGLITNIFYGFLFGAAVFSFLLLIIYMLGGF